MKEVIAWAYLVSGLVLPLFYLPQILRFRTDRTRLASYSMSKSVAQFLLRGPTLVFALVVVQHDFMTFVLSLDLLGRAAELWAAVAALRRQYMPAAAILREVLPTWARTDRREGVRSSFLPSVLP